MNSVPESIINALWTHELPNLKQSNIDWDRGTVDLDFSTEDKTITLNANITPDLDGESYQIEFNRYVRVNEAGNHSSKLTTLDEIENINDEELVSTLKELLVKHA